VRLPDLFNDSIIAGVLRHVMHVTVCSSDELTAVRQSIKYTSYGWWHLLDPYYAPGSIHHHNRRQGDKYDCPLVLRTQNPKRGDRTWITWVGPDRETWVKSMRPLYRDRAFQKLESQLTERELTTEEWRWLNLLRK
jgi:hypothetical protein